MSSEDDPLAPLWVKAETAASCGDYPSLLIAWKELAKNGVWQLTARVGEIYERGATGVERDQAQALYWYRRAVFESDDPIAHVGLGRAYFNGMGVPRDSAQALSHFEKAYAQKRPDAAFHLGRIYADGRGGVKRDYSRAKAYLEFAASAEYFLAYIALARIALLHGRLIKAFLLTTKGLRLGLRIAKAAPDDPRLLGIKIPEPKPR